MGLIDSWYSRPRLFEIADQWWCPAFMRQHEYTFLEYMWSHHIESAQKVPLCVRAARIVHQAVRDVEEAHNDPEIRTGRVGIMSRCRWWTFVVEPEELRLLLNGSSTNQKPIPFLLSDLRPHPVWPELKAQSESGHLDFIPHSVDATSSANIAQTDKLQVRTLFVSFHHMDQDGARKVIEDAMRNAESLVIVEMSEFSFAGLFTGPVALTILGQIYTPRLRPSWWTLLFTYIIPWTPIMFFWDAMISGYRTYSSEHVLHLAKLAERNVNAEIAARNAATAGVETDSDEVHNNGQEGQHGAELRQRKGDKVNGLGAKAERVEWVWEFGREEHTKPGAMMLSAIGRRVRK